VGKVFSASELRRLGDLCERHDLLLCSDEIHCDLVLSSSSKRHTPLAALGDERLMARTVTLHAPSKTYNVPGLCCSYAVIPDDTLRQRFKKAARWG
jgi:cystathionine beta-lyase